MIYNSYKNEITLHEIEFINLDLSTQVGNEKAGKCDLIGNESSLIYKYKLSINIMICNKVLYQRDIDKIIN